MFCPQMEPRKDHYCCSICGWDDDNLQRIYGNNICCHNDDKKEFYLYEIGSLCSTHSSHKEVREMQKNHNEEYHNSISLT